jgi:integrase
LIFSVSNRTDQNAFKTASESIDFELNPHLLRSVFADRCAKAGIKDKYIDAFCGRTSQGMLAKHYTDYSPDALQEQYLKVEDILTLGS